MGHKPWDREWKRSAKAKGKRRWRREAAAELDPQKVVEAIRRYERANGSIQTQRRPST